MAATKAMEEEEAPPEPAPAGPAEEEDPFSSDDFDVLAYVNKTFPTEESLSGLDDLVGVLRRKVRRVDGEILGAVRRQSGGGGRAARDLSDARASIGELASRLAEVRRKAALAEAMVQEICRDIRKLDHAKRHLTATITALRRLAMLANAVDALQAAAERSDYAEAAQLLEAVQALAGHFAAHAGVPGVAELRGRVAGLEGGLRAAALKEFGALGEEGPPPALLGRLRACCQLVEVLGYQARDELIDSVCKREMGVYTQIFSAVGETAKLERTVNRYKWLLRRLEARRDVWALFPPGWHVPALLCIMFCNITKTQLAEILDLKSAELPGQVDSLLKCVEATNIFEGELARRFGGPDAGRAAEGSGSDAEAGSPRSGGASGDDEAPASRVRARAERAARERRAAEQDLAAAASPERRKQKEHATAAAVARASFRGSISSVFTPYLHVYVEAVERDLLGTLDRLMREESWAPLSAEAPVLRSADALTDAVRGEMRDCVARVSRGRPLLELAAVFGRTYRAYASRLAGRLPRTAGGGPAAAALPALGSPDWHVRLSEADASAACLVITTAEHCQELVAGLSRALAARLEPPLGQQVDLGAEEGEFRGLSTSALGCLLLGTLTRTEPSLAALARTNWAALEMAGDQSEYVGALRAVLVDVGARLGAALPSNHFRFFCDKLLRALAPLLLEAVLRCRRLSDVACQQLRLDVEGIRALLVEMAREGGLDAAALSGYASDVAVALGRVEAVLKVAGAPAEGLVEAFAELVPGGGPSDLQRILDLKVLKRSEYQALLEQYQRRLGRSAAAAAAPPPGGAAALGAGPSGRLVSPGSGGQAGVRLPAGTTQAAQRASAAAQDMASRLRLNANVAAAKASAAAASDSMRETMGRTLGAMRSFKTFMQRDQQQQGQ